ncbi:MAG: DUF983 domain-containing protein [Saprospiraceae bacterium]
MKDKKKSGITFSWRAMWNYKCPRCKDSDLFVKPLVLSNPGHMHERCDKCNLDFEPEPGFYFGALIISYGLSSWLLLVPTLVLVLIYDWSVGAGMGVAIAIAILTYLPILRVSRSLYLHLSMRYDKSLENTDNSASKYSKTLF